MMKIDSEFKICKDEIHDKGWILVKDLGKGFDYLSLLIKLGNLMPQYDGKKIWDIKVNKNVSMESCSLGSVEVAPHTEYYEGNSLPPTYLALWCVNPASCGGGRISLADGYKFLDLLSEAERNHLKEIKYLYKSEKGLFQLGLGSSAYHPILSYNLERKPIMRFNTDGMEEGDSQFLFRFRSKFLKFYADNSIDFFQPQFSLLIWDNHRMIHARSSGFVDMDRHLVRIWIGEEKNE